MADSTLRLALARAFLAGAPDLAGLTGRAARLFQKQPRWLPALARRYAAHFRGSIRPRRREVEEFLERDHGLKRTRLKPSNLLANPPQMWPDHWPVPPLVSRFELAAWLGLQDTELDWFADLKAWELRPGRPQLLHYHYLLTEKKQGGWRLLEAPKPRLKAIQRQILTQILEPLAPHPAAHGFRRGRSIVTFAAPHAGRHTVLRLDLQDFFPRIPGVRIQTLFRLLGYPEPVADLLGGLCTNVTPRGIWPLGSNFLQRQIHRRPHLPQGAPTSPALANLCAFRADCRLSGLAAAYGFTYTRYADDLAFSGDAEFGRSASYFAAQIRAILEEEGFAVNQSKTRILRQGVAQHLAGLTVNAHPNLPRAEFDRLKATLTNCIRHGCESQNREGHPDFRRHLEGKVAYVEMVNPARGAKLRALLERLES